MRLIVLLLSLFSLAAADSIRVLEQAHAHNDYEHARPLLDALAHGFCSVEADIHLAAGKLLVAHDPEQVNPERTLERLYLDPLRELAQKNGGRVYRGGPPLILLIDLKTEAESTYSELKKVLERYQSILTRFGPNGITTNSVTVILSGNRPRETLFGERSRLAAFDGRLSDLGQNLPIAFMPLVSDNWRSHFQWRGEGEFTGSERSKLKELVRKAHEEGRRIRFWAVPDKIEAWRILREAGVDLINTDDLAGLARFLRE
jgi:hypothetical protein